MKKLGVLVVTAALAGLALSACGGGDGDAADGEAATGDQPSGAAATDGNAPASGLGSGELVKRRKELTFLARYEVTSTFDGTTTEAMWVIAQKPPKTFLEIKPTDPGSDGTSVLVIDDGVSAFSCIPTTPGQGACFKGPSSGPTGPGTNSDALYSGLDGPNVKEVGSRKIAGRDARCFETTGTTSDGTYCVDKSGGFVLSIDSKALKMIATEVSTKVDDSQFEPPFPVQ